MRLVTKAGEYRVWRYHNVWYEEEGRPLYVIGCAQDVTEEVRLERALRKARDELELRVQERTAELTAVNEALRAEIAERERAEAALRESEERYRGLFENANDVIATFTLDGVITSVNRATEALLGWPREELVGRHFRVVTTPATAALVEERTRRFLAGEKPTSNLEVEVLCKNGSIVLFECRTRTIHSQTGSLVGFQGIFRNITERKRAEAQLRKTKEAAEAADRAKSEFLATMSHELRTPLNVIIGYLDLLLEGEFGALTNKQIDTLRRVHKNTRGLFELITDVLDLNRLEAGRLPMELKEVQVTDLLKDIETETQGFRDLSDLTFLWQVEGDLPSLYTDPGKLKMVIKNLLSNATKFTKEGSITVNARWQRGGIAISVTDTGIGIPAEQQVVIFEAFRQGSGPGVQGAGGVGLGLHIVRRLLDMLGGTIEVESEVSQGSTFRVWLPAEMNSQ